MDKEDVAYIYIHIYTHTLKYYSATKKNEFLPSVTTWMDQKGIMLNGINQTEKDKCCMISLMYGI